MNPLLILLCVALAIAGGCSKEEMKKAYNQAKTQTQGMADSAAAKTKKIADSTTAAVKAKLPATGSIELRSSTPIDKTSRAVIEVISIGDGRPSSMQIYSYDPDSTRMTYPAIHLHGPTTAIDVASLAGQTIACDLYLQVAEGGPIAMTKPGDSVRVSFNSFDAVEGTIRAGITGAKLMKSDDTRMTLDGGDIVAVAKLTVPAITP